MKVLSIIGTRPQYVKFKPLYESFRKSKIDHIVIDSKQHYSHDVSKKIIDDLNLEIDYSLNNSGLKELDFITQTIKDLGDMILDICPSVILIFGDTNTTFCAAIAANKLKIPIAHVESGERSLTKKPEEINRQFADSVSDIHFCSALRHMKNVDNPVYTGDLEYELLNFFNPKINLKNFGLMTLHRQENMNQEKITKYFQLISRLDQKVIFPLHHRTSIFLKQSKIKIPKNLIIKKPFCYTEAVEKMSNCSFILTDSGGIQKCAPFFGKKCLVLRDRGEEWKETYDKGYCTRIDKNINNSIDWLKSNVTQKREKYFYCSEKAMPSEIIIEKLRII